MAPAMPCKIIEKKCWSDASNKKTKLACILEADESIRLRMKESLLNHHEDHIEKETIHCSIVILFHKFIPLSQAIKIPAAKEAVNKDCKKLEKISAWNLTKVRNKKVVIDEARTKAQKFVSLH